MSLGSLKIPLTQVFGVFVGTFWGGPVIPRQVAIDV